MKNPFKTDFPVGIDLGSRSVKMVRLGRARRDRWFLERVRSDEAPAEILRDKIGGGTAEGVRAAFSILDEKINSYDLLLPKIPLNEIPTAIEWELKKIIPALESVVYDSVTARTDNGYRATCFVAPRETVTAIFKEGESFGVVPAYLEAESSAQLACLELLDAKRVWDGVAIIDLGYSSFRVTFVGKNQVVSARSLPFGFYFGLAAAQLNEAASETKRLELEQLITMQLQRLCEEFLKSDSLAQEQMGVSETKEVLLCGGGACINWVVNFIQTHLPGKSVTPLNPLTVLGGVGKEIDPATGPVWVTAVGLGLRRDK